MNDVCVIQNGQVDPTQEPYLNLFHIAPDDIESSSGRILEFNTALQDGVSSGNYYFQPGAILYSKIRPNLRKVVRVDFEGVCSADVYPIYANKSINRDFLFYLLLSPRFTAYANTRSIRSAIPKINRDDLLAYPFDLPNLKDQVLIVHQLDALETAILGIEAQIQHLKNIKRQVMSALLEEGSKLHVQ